jgi:hypothetical protein
MEDVEKICPCAFCNSKCPECGSADIGFQFKAVFWCEKDIQDKIKLDKDFDQIKMTCKNCGASIEDESFDNHRLAIDNALDFPISLTLSHDKDGKMKPEEWTL